MEEWDKSIEEAKKNRHRWNGLEFIDVDVEAFKEKVLPLHESMLQENEKIRDLYDHIQAANEKSKKEDSRMETMHKVKAGIMQVLGFVIIALFAFYDPWSERIRS